MAAPSALPTLDEQMDEWRRYVRRQSQGTAALPRLEHQLRDEIAGLTSSGLAADEAFLIAIRRMAREDAGTADFALAESDRLWKRGVASAAEPSVARAPGPRERVVALCVAVGAAVVVKAPALFGLDLRTNADVYARNAALLVLPLLAGFLFWKRRLSARMAAVLAAAFVFIGVFANIYPFTRNGSTEALTALHAGMALWLVVGVAYAGARWRESAGRMDFIRFSGEWFIYLVLIGLGGGVFTACMAMLFKAIGVNAQPFFQLWLVPCGAAGAVIVAAWLVEARQGVIESMAPVLARLFTPLFTALLITFLVAVLWTGRGVTIERDVLVAFDLLLAVVLGLLLYNLSSRDPNASAGAFDWLQVALLVSALLADAVALWAIASRISEFGFSANRVAALGENVILLVNLFWSAVLYVGYMRRGRQFSRLERWQTSYLPVYAAWAAVVVVVFPPLFKYA